MDDKEWRTGLDKYLELGYMSADWYDQLNDYQKFTVQSIKKSIKRITDKKLKQNGEYKTKEYL